MRTYRTKSGDMWDMIAKEMYDNEMHLSFLMANNGHLLDYFVFPSGIILNIEDLPENIPEDDDLPEWRD